MPAGLGSWYSGFIRGAAKLEIMEVAAPKIASKIRSGVAEASRTARLAESGIPVSKSLGQGTLFDMSQSPMNNVGQIEPAQIVSVKNPLQMDLGLDSSVKTLMNLRSGFVKQTGAHAVNPIKATNKSVASSISNLSQISTSGYQNILRHAGYTALWGFGGYQVGAGAAGFFGADEEAQRKWGRFGAGVGMYGHISKNVLGRQFFKPWDVSGASKYQFRTSTGGTMDRYFSRQFAQGTFENIPGVGRRADTRMIPGMGMFRRGYGI